ncbi:MAG: hypothetical protein ABIS21_05310, partial [Acidimicrobiales bacterium]
AWDASGWVIISAVSFTRSLVLLAMRWPPPPPLSALQAVISVGLLALVDLLLVIRVLSYRQFVKHDLRKDPREDLQP